MVNVIIDARRNRSGESPLTQEQIDKIQKASDEAYAMVTKGANVLENIYNQSGPLIKRGRKRRNAWNNNTNVKRWFGTEHLTNTSIKWTTWRLARLKEKLEETVSFTIIQHQSGDRSWLCHDDGHPNVAYTGLISPIKLCLRFFWEDDELRARTVVHELCHHIGLIDRRVEGNKVYDRGPAQNLAINDPREARKNPSNIAYFCDEYRTKTGTGGSAGDPYFSILYEIVNRFKETYPDAQFSGPRLRLSRHEIEYMHGEWEIKKLLRAGVFGGIQRKIYVGLHFEHPDSDFNKRFVDSFKSMKSELDGLLHADVEFCNLRDGRVMGGKVGEGFWIEHSIDSLKGSDGERLINWGVESMIKIYEFMHTLCLRCGTRHEFHPPDTQHTILYLYPEGPQNYIRIPVRCGNVRCRNTIMTYWRKRESSAQAVMRPLENQ